MVTEKDIEKKIIMSVQGAGSVVFKNNVGYAQKTDPNTGKKYWIRFGLCEGSSDLIGITPVTITQGMVGKTIGVFTAIEVKKDVTKSYDKHRMDTQKRFIDFINRNGGFAFKSDDPEKAQKEIEKRRKVLGQLYSGR